MIDKLKCLFSHEWVELGLVREDNEYSSTISKAKVCLRCGHVDLMPVAEVKIDSYPEVDTLVNKLMKYYGEE